MAYSGVGAHHRDRRDGGGGVVKTLAGIFAPIGTPFREDEEIDFAALEDNMGVYAAVRHPRLPGAGLERREQEPHRGREAGGAADHRRGPGSATRW